MRVLHTADWHLGQTLAGFSRGWEHARFLGWLLDRLEEHQADVLLIAGDVFDTANPAPSAQQAYYRFLAECRRRLPSLEILVVGGNHDSPSRLDAPKEVLDIARIRVVGGFPRGPDGAVDPERALVPLHRRDGTVGAWALAVPFLRRGDLPLGADGPADNAHEELVQAYRRLYRGLLTQAQARRSADQCLIATGHCYMTGGVVSELSERKVQVGNQHALPLDVFPAELAYVALGHLHRAQSVLGKESVRYAGSPIPLSMAERDYQHQVLLLDLAPDRIRSLQVLRVPRAVELLCLPEEPRPLPEVLALLAGLPPRAEVELERRAFLEVKVELDRASPRLRQDIEEALADKAVRLVRIEVAMRGGQRPRPPAPDLDSLRPEDVFRATYAKQRGGEVPADLGALFAELLEEVHARRGQEDRG